MKNLILFYSNHSSRYRIFYIVFNVIPTAPPTLDRSLLKQIPSYANGRKRKPEPQP